MGKNILRPVNPIQRYLKILIVILLVIAGLSGLLLRSVEVLNHNYVFEFDQGRDYLAVKNIVVNHKLTLIGSEIGAGAAGFKGIFHGPFYYYSLTIPFILLRGDPYGGIILMFLFGVGSIMFGFILGKKMYGNWVGLLFAVLIALSPPLIAQSRFVWNSHPSSFFILLSFYFLYTYLSGKKDRFLFFTSFTSAFVYNFELAIAIPLCLTLLLFCVFILRLRKIKQYSLLLGGFFLALSPMIFFELRHNLMATRGLVEYVFHHPETNVSRKFIEMLLNDHLRLFYYNFFYSFPRQIPILSGVFGLVFIVGIIYLLIKEKNEIIRKFLLFLLILLPVNFIVFGFLRNNVYHYYLVDLNLAYLLLFAIMVYFFNVKKHTLFGLLLALFLFSYFIVIPDYVVNAIADYKDYGGTAKIKGKTDALDYIYKDANKNKFGLMIYSPPIYTYPYDYLIWWHGEKKYNYLPYNDKKGLFYLWIETDHSKPWSYKGWLETVVKEGTVIKTATLSSGFIIQKRDMSNEKAK